MALNIITFSVLYLYSTMFEVQQSISHPPINNLDTTRRSETFILNDLDRLDLPLVEGNIYILAAWDSNTYIRAGDNNHFEIIDQYGDVLRTGKSYILINPTF